MFGRIEWTSERWSSVCVMTVKDPKPCDYAPEHRPSSRFADLAQMIWQKISSDGFKVYSDGRSIPFDVRIAQVPASSTSPFGHGVTVKSRQSLVDGSPKSWYRVSCCPSFRRLWPDKEFCRIWPESRSSVDPRSYPFEAHWLNPPPARYRCGIYHIDRDPANM